MTKMLRKLSFLLLSFSLIGLYSCNDDDDPMINVPTPTGTSTTFTLADVGAGISGTATFAELSDNTTSITIQLANTPAGGSHPAHIHMNSAAETGGIAVSLESVDGTTGTSTTIVSALDNGTATTYAQLIAYDGYINVHLSATDLGTIVAQGDIGTNVLTGDTKVYPLNERAAPGISGTATFAKRVSGETLVTLALQNTPDGGSHPAHIHTDNAATGGGIAVSLNNVDGTTGMSKTNIAALNDGTAITYEELLAYDGYINVHLSADALGTIVAQGDIGSNELTGDAVTYTLAERDAPGISGTAVFAKRINGETLVTLALQNTPDGGSHPAHIHDNTALEGGGIAFSLTSVDGTTGMSMTNISDITYDELIAFNGYINVHLSADALGTIVAQGDIGGNALTGNTAEYVLNEKDAPGINGNVVFAERVDGTSLVTITLTGTPANGSHPAHIHDGTAAVGGGIAISLTSVNGTTGMSMTNVNTITYSELIDFDGYINVHLSADALGTIVAQGDIGRNG